MRRTRLTRKDKSARKERLKSDDMSLFTAMDTVQKEMNDSASALYSTEAEGEHRVMSEHMRTAYSLMKNHPDGHVMLRVELDEEPVEGAGRIMVCRAEDFVNFKNIEFEDLDKGHVFTLPRSRVKKILGVVQFETPVDSDRGGYGLVPETSS